MISLRSWLMLMTFSALDPVFQIPRVKGVSDLHYRNGYAIIVFRSTKAMGKRKEREPT